jgi:hypothetical protein
MNDNEELIRLQLSHQQTYAAFMEEVLRTEQAQVAALETISKTLQALLMIYQRRQP